MHEARTNLSIEKSQRLRKLNPFLGRKDALIYLCSDGLIQLEINPSPEPFWYIIGGPALIADTEPSRTPQWVHDVIRGQNLVGKNIGMYRVVGSADELEPIWNRKQTWKTTATLRYRNKLYKFISVDANWRQTLSVITYGVFNPIIKLPPIQSDQDAWDFIEIHNIGFLTADRRLKAMVSYLRVVPMEPIGLASYSQPSTLAAMDFGRWLDASQHETTGGHLKIGSTAHGGIIISKLEALEASISGLRILLNNKLDATEEEVHQFLVNHPILLDVYSDVSSKPPFLYPETSNNNEKKFVVPDFVLRQSDGRYVIIEIERPSKRLMIQCGQPSSKITQAAFQIVEFRTFVRDHHSVLQDRFPGIQQDVEYWLIVGRINQLSRANALDQLRNTYNVNRVFTYDDVLTRAETVLRNLKLTRSIGT